MAAQQSASVLALVEKQSHRIARREVELESDAVLEDDTIGEGIAQDTSCGRGVCGRCTGGAQERFVIGGRQPRLPSQ
jgi:hypothetical protein